MTQTRSRIPLVTPADAPILVRGYFQDGPPGPLAAAAAHVPEVMVAFMPFVGAVYAGGAVPERLREIAVLRLSAAQGCRYCTETHADIAIRAGFTQAEVAALVAGVPGPSWSAAEAAVINFTEAMSGEPENAVALLRPAFADHEVVELVMLASATIMLNRFATALALPTAPDCKLRTAELRPA